MELSDAIRKRRSVRKYKPGTIPPEHTEKMLEAAMFAPSARNSRPWEFIVITDPEDRRKLGEMHPYCRAADASLVIIICGLPELSEFWQQDCGAVIQNILLQATDLGYGTCWCGIYPTDRTEPISKFLGRSHPVAAITVGLPAESPAAKGHFQKDKVTYL